MRSPESKANPAASRAASRAVLDGPAARVAAFAVFLLAAAALGWFHRDDILPPEAAAPAEDPAATCIAERWAVIGAMAADGTIDATRAQQFKASAEALCRARTSAN